MKEIERMEDGIPSMVVSEEDAVLVMNASSAMTLMLPTEIGASTRKLPVPHRVILAIAMRLRTEGGKFERELLAWLDQHERMHGELTPDKVIGGPPGVGVQ